MKLQIPTSPALLPQRKIEGQQRIHARTVEGEKERLHKATKEFESFFTYYMLKTMRQTVPKNALSEGLPMGDSMGKETFTDLFDMEVAKSMKSSGNRSIADLLYKSMEKVVVAQFNDAPSVARAASPKAAPFPINMSKAAQPKPIPVKPDPIPLPKSTTIKPLPPVPQRAKSAETERPHSKHASIISRYGHHIEEAALETKLDSALIASVIQAESGGDSRAVSSAGAKGLMQLIDTTASDYGVRDAFNPRDNIRGGSRFLKYLMDRYQDVKLALAAYNAGPGNVDKYKGIPPFKETQDFVQRVTGFIRQAARNVTHTESKEL